jgi:malic enzyme
VARGVAIAVIKQAAIDGVATKAIADPEAVVAANMWEPEYPIYA